MKATNSLLRRQRGAFAIEFAMLSVFLGTLFLFSIDVVIKLSIKGKLDRLSYSIVSVAKERTQLYGEDFTISQPEATQLYNIAESSLQRTIGSYDSSSSTLFGMVVEEMVDSDSDGTGEYNAYFLGDNVENNTQGCVLDMTLEQIEEDDELALSVVTTWNNTASIYRVTLCYNTNDYTSAVLGTGFSTVQSSSSVVGR